MEQILLIDDDAVINFIHDKIISSVYPDATVIILENGQKAVDYIQKNQQNSYLVFLDINMPIMDGWEFLEAMQDYPNKENLNIHMLTSSVDLRDRSRAEDNSMVRSYLPKPLTKDVLRSIPFGEEPA